MLKRFFTLFVMTFLICIFILLMQFLWMHVKDLVGKGISISILAEFFLYASFTTVPLGLPLAILLASLMTFGNLGENFELTAMKAAGISLFRIMRPLIIFIAFVSVGAFYFSNNVLPIAQSKLWALIFSLRQKSPELDIPVGEFYSGINGLNVYVRGKDGRILKDLMIYDFSSGFNNATVMTADSGYVQLTADNKHLLLTLYDGESFENLKEQKKASKDASIPYRREVFKQKEILIDFDSELNRYDESLLQDQHVSKNVNQLIYSIDSVGKVLDEKLEQQGRDVLQRNYLGRETNNGNELKFEEGIDIQQYSLDSLFMSLEQVVMEEAMTQAVTKAKEKKEQIQYNKIMVNDSIVYVRRHLIELHRKFTLSFACLIFFFIGAPLGAIIRKGGLGMPAVVSVLMFVVYYIIDNTGYKMAREGLWEVYQGMWLSSAVLLPIGIFLTYKAAVDATLFSSDQYKKVWENIKTKITNLIKRNKKTKPETKQA
ncbi:YjgP/YjgQ family permease [Paludibacter sp. 221]|nr:LptF/LptG family permease [Paludibacter sp. 221]NDV47340.1 YjgP/YjgQ family permease [Paludibacter sp. 221]